MPRRGKLDQAEGLYQQALQLNPQSELVLLDLGLLYEMGKKNDEGGRRLPADARREPAAAPSPASASAGLYVGQKKLDEALEQFRELEKIENDPQETRIKIGLIYFEKGDYDKAATELNLVLAAEPDRTTAFATTSAPSTPRTRNTRRPPPSSIRSRRRRTISSIRAFSSATSKEKDDKIDEAIVEIKRALEVKKDSVDLLGFLASLYREKKDNETALQIAAQDRRDRAGERQAVFSLGAIYDENKQKEGHRRHAEGDRSQSQNAAA